MVETAAPVKGTQPLGTRTEAEASQKVREMFTQIAPKYDLLNHLLSLQLDRLWRARAARLLAPILKRRRRTGVGFVLRHWGPGAFAGACGASASDGR